MGTPDNSGRQNPNQTADSPYFRTKKTDCPSTKGARDKMQSFYGHQGVQAEDTTYLRYDLIPSTIPSTSDWYWYIAGSATIVEQQNRIFDTTAATCLGFSVHRLALWCSSRWDRAVPRQVHLFIQTGEETRQDGLCGVTTLRGVSSQSHLRVTHAEG